MKKLKNNNIRKVNPVNETYIVISYSGSRVIVPPNATGVINTTETGNVTINIQPNGLSFNQGRAVITTEGGAAAAAEGEDGENATIRFVLLTRTNPDGSGNGTSITYFSTNSTGQLAFLDNLVAIGQIELNTLLKRALTVLQSGSGRVERFHLRICYLNPNIIQLFREYNTRAREFEMPLDAWY